MTTGALEALGLVAPEDPAPTVVRLNTSRNTNRLGNERSWPDYELCVKGTPVAKEGGPDRSMADFFWVHDGSAARPQHPGRCGEAARSQLKGPGERPAS